MRLRWKPFVKKRRAQRKKEVFRLKHKIKRVAPVLGGLFYSRDYIHGENHWLDIYFLSEKDNATLYNATLCTASYRFSSDVDSLAFDRAYALKGFEPVRFVKEVGEDGKIYSTLASDPQQALPHPEFDGLTRRDWTEREELRIVERGEVSVYESVEMDTGYSYGIGLSVVLNVPALTREVLETFVREWRANGEQPFRSLTPIQFPASILTEVSAIESNAILDKDDWAILLNQEKDKNAQSTK